MSVEEETQAKRRENEVAECKGIRSYLIITRLAHRYYVKRIVIRRIADLFLACKDQTSHLIVSWWRWVKIDSWVDPFSALRSRMGISHGVIQWGIAAVTAGYDCTAGL
jgi:hypothetical protein